MELKSLNCPNCGAVVKIPDGVERFLCPYCHSQIQIDDGKITIDLNANINLNHQYTDVAKMRELELREEERIRREERQLAKERKERLQPVICILVIVLGIIIYIFSCILAANDNEVIGRIFSVLGAFVGFIYPFVIHFTAPKHWRIQRNKTQQGCLGSIVNGFAGFFAIIIFLCFWACIIILPFVITSN